MAVMLLSRRKMLGLGAAFCAVPVGAARKPLVFAAASLKTVLDDMQANTPTMPFDVAYGGSGLLARQILQGAPADIYISAHPVWMDHIAQAGLLRDGPVDLLTNRLVLATRAGAGPVTLDDRFAQSAARIAMGYVDAVPAGQYGRAAFDGLGLWDAVAARIVQTENVRAALALVARGEVPYAVVYDTDVMADPNTEIAAVFDPASYPAVSYPMGLMARATDAGAAMFADLRGPKAQFFYHLHGFEVLS